MGKQRGQISGIFDKAKTAMGGMPPSKAAVNMIKKGRVPPKATQAGAFHVAHHAIAKKAHHFANHVATLPQRKLLSPSAALGYGAAAAMKTRK